MTDYTTLPYDDDALLVDVAKAVKEVAVKVGPTRLGDYDVFNCTQSDFWEKVASLVVRELTAEQCKTIFESISLLEDNNWLPETPKVGEGIVGNSYVDSDLSSIELKVLRDLEAERVDEAYLRKAIRSAALLPAPGDEVVTLIAKSHLRLLLEHQDNNKGEYGVLSDVASRECETPGLCALTQPPCLPCRARHMIDLKKARRNKDEGDTDATA
jgi:hypothetical protein